MIRKYVKLDVVPGGEAQRFHISEDDERSRHIVFRLFASKGELTLPSGTTAAIEGRKPDGTELRVSGTRSNMEVTFDLPKAAADVPGETICNVVLKSGSKRLYTERFRLVVDENVKEA